MDIFDLHSDTVVTCIEKNQTLFQNMLQLDLQRGIEQIDTWIQTFAFWIDDQYRGEIAWQQFLIYYQFFKQQMEQHSIRLSLFQDTPSRHHCHAVLAVEGGAVLGGNLSRIAVLKQMGISFMTLTWNGENEIGGGAFSQAGLHDFGKQVIHEMEQYNIVVDVSHLNEKTFYDVEKIAKKSYIATHSNAKGVCAHPRNLSDEQIRCIIDRKGLIGINFYPEFVTGEKDCTCDDICRHIEHILVLGGEDVLALGSDFDGARMPSEITDIKGLANLYDSMLKYFHKEIVEKICYQNAVRFIREHKILQS